MTEDEIVEYATHSPENTNPAVLRDMLIQLNNNLDIDNIINYVMTTPHNTNKKVLRDMLN